MLPDLEVAAEWDGWPEGTLSLAFDANLEHYARIDRAGTVTVTFVDGVAVVSGER